MTKKLDIILFGASGFTGSFTLLQLHKFANTFTWGVAGRNKEKLKTLLAKSAQRCGDDIKNVPVIVADVNNQASIMEMTSKAKVVINCCGPYDKYGEVVVKACIETRTHYIDVTIEIQFINRILLNYGDLAEDKGVIIVNACGIEYLLADLGVCFVKDNSDETFSSIDAYLTVHKKGSGYLDPMGNVGTLKSVLNFAKNAVITDLPDIYLPKKIEGGWACRFPTFTEKIVYRSQQYFSMKKGKRPLQFHSYVKITSFYHTLLCFVYLFFGLLLSKFRFTRSIMLKYPRVFTRGLISHQPSEDELNSTNFTVTFICKAWSKKLPKPQLLPPPTKEIIAQVSGSNPGYGFTSLAVTLGALTILSESDKIPGKGGVYTPAMAFSKTSLMQQLQNNGVDFKVTSIN